MKKNKDISVLIPVYNVENYIKECLKSIFNNTIINKAEIVIVNDGSSDNSMEIVNQVLAEYPSMKEATRIINNPGNQGIAYTRQRLIEEAKGAYIIFIDSDDTVDSTFLEKLYNKAQENDADIVQCNYKRIGADNSEETGTLPVDNTPYNNILLKLDNKTPSFLCTRLIRRKLIVDNNIKYEDMDIIYGEDEFLLYRLLCHAKYVDFVNEPLYHYIWHKSSVTSSIVTKKLALSKIKVMNYSEEYILKYYSSNEIKDYLLRRKLFTKIYLIFRSNKHNQKEYRKLWPETDPIINNSNIPFYKKIVLKNVPLVANFILLMVGVLKYHLDYFNRK